MEQQPLIVIFLRDGEIEAVVSEQAGLYYRVIDVVERSPLLCLLTNPQEIIQVHSVNDYMESIVETYKD